MKIHHKLLGVTLPMALIALIMGAYITFQLSRQALHQIAHRWLETRLDEGMVRVGEQEAFLRMYGITNIHAGTRKAQYDALQGLAAVRIGEHGYIYVLDNEGRVLFSPQNHVMADSVAGEPWFRQIRTEKKGQLNYTLSGRKHLARFARFAPWDWFIVATDPYDEIYGSLNKTRDYLFTLALWGSLLISFIIIVLTRHLFHPLQLLVGGAEMVKQGNLDIAVPIKSNDEMGDLSRVFNAMARELKKNVEELQSSEQQLHYLNSQLLTAQENERKRLATELHDEVGQSLTVMKLKMILLEESLSRNLAEGLSRNDDNTAAGECEEMVQYIDTTIENVRRLCRDLTPTVITDLGLAAALMWLVENMAHHFDVTPQFALDNVDEMLSLDRQLLVYRIFQEALSNAAKHAHADRIVLSGSPVGNRFIFTIEDNGRGFDWAHVKERPYDQRGLGLATMKERARMLGGQLTITTGPHTGTKLHFTVEIDKGSDHGNL